MKSFSQKAKRLWGGVAVLMLGLVSLASCQKKAQMPEGFVRVTDVVPEVILEIRYYSTYNFVGTRVDGYEAPIALMTREAADSLAAVQRDLSAMGYVIKIYDTYRPQTAVNHFIRWAEQIEDTLMKAAFYPEVDKTILFDAGFICARSSHSRGSTADLTLVDLRTGKDLDMGGVFDYFGELSYPDYEDISDEQKANRAILRDAMMRHGFKQLDTEWWHFTLANEPYPDTYFDFPVTM